jgi:hypothetical protein
VNKENFSLFAKERKSIFSHCARDIDIPYHTKSKEGVFRSFAKSEKRE